MNYFAFSSMCGSLWDYQNWMLYIYIQVYFNKRVIKLVRNIFAH